MGFLYGSNIKIMVKKSNTMADKSAPLGIMDLTYRPNVPANDPWEAFTGTDSGLGKETNGTWAFPAADLGTGNTRHYYIYNSKGQVLLTLLSVPNPSAVAAGAQGMGVLHRSTGGTLSEGDIEWKVLGKN